jgi:hypothetical protein
MNFGVRVKSIIIVSRFRILSKKALYLLMIKLIMIFMPFFDNNKY